MNDRIVEIASRAGYDPEVFALCRDGMEKFALLLIQDCIDCVDGYTKPRTFSTHYDAVEQIKANFGIE